MTISVKDLNQRSVDIFKELVDTFVETGEPVGSRTLSRRLAQSLSPATIRNVMADLEDAGLLYAPHTSAGRLPTPEGLRFFVHGLLQVGTISDADLHELEAHSSMQGKNLNQLLEEATSTLSGLTQCAGLVMAPKSESPLKHVEFVSLGERRILVVTISQDAVVENRIVELEYDLASSILNEITNYMNAHFVGRTFSEIVSSLKHQLEKDRLTLDQLTSKVVEDGVVAWLAPADVGNALIVKGQANLLKDVTVIEGLDQIRNLFTALDTKEAVISLVEASIKADGVQIFVGSDNPLFSQTGCSMVLAPYKSQNERILGAIGVVGPTHMNYGRIIPLVDHTAKIISKLL